MFPYLIIGGAYFAWCLVKESRDRREARRILEETPDYSEVVAEPQNGEQDEN